MSIRKEHTDQRKLGIQLHDLRHRLALHACDLRLTMGRIAGGAKPVAELYGDLLVRLDTALTRTLHLQGATSPVTESVAYQEDFLREIWSEFQRAGRLPAGNCHLDLHPGHRFRVFSTPLHSLLLNLLENACLAAPEGPITLRAEGGSLVVENGGELMPGKLMAGLNRGAAPATRGGRGHGLGLILNSARELGLDLTVARGSLGTRIQLQKQSASRVLLIEDDPELRLMLQDYLDLEGHQVTAVSGGDDHLPRALRFDSVVADLNLDGERGDQLLARWKEADPAVRTILLTGQIEAADRVWAGVDRVIIKPGLQELVAVLAVKRGRSA